MPSNPNFPSFTQWLNKQPLPKFPLGSALPAVKLGHLKVAKMVDSEEEMRTAMRTRWPGPEHRRAIDIQVERRYHPERRN
jgi:hypothetical protein